MMRTYALLLHERRNGRPLVEGGKERLGIARGLGDAERAQAHVLGHVVQLKRVGEPCGHE
jgi:hypothetical protein